MYYGTPDTKRPNRNQLQMLINLARIFIRNVKLKKITGAWFLLAPLSKIKFYKGGSGLELRAHSYKENFVRKFLQCLF